MTTNDLDRIHREIDQCRAALNDRRVGLIASRRLYNRLGQLYRELDRAEIDLAIDHTKAMDHETEIATQPTVYRNG